MAITCAILPYSVSATDIFTKKQDYIIPVVFQVGTTGKYMSCSETKINVESIRWPATRFTDTQSTASIPSLPLLNMLKSSDNPTSPVDAAIWVMPMCGNDRPREVCLQAFTKAACFPYCMGIHQRGKANSLMRLYNAPDWRDRVHILNRDCAQFSASNIEDQKVETQTVIGPASTGYSVLDLGVQATWAYTNTDITSVLSNDWAGSSVIIQNAGVSTTTCVSSSLAYSSIPKSFFQNNGEYGEAFFSSTLASGQPFLFAGDTILTAVCDSINPSDPLAVPNCDVEVHRIYGSESNQFTLVQTNNKLPARAVPDTPEQVSTLLRAPLDRLTIPYSFTTNAWMQNPAAATEEAIFYAVNPYWQLYTGFLQYCYSPDELGQLQLVATSSFSPITIWRVYPYVYCPPSQSAGCYEGLMQGIQIPDSQRPRYLIF